MKTYNCEEINAVLDEYLDGETDTSVTAAVKEHLAECAGCRGRLDELRDLRRLTATASAEAPDDLHARIMAAVHENKAASRRIMMRRVSAAAASVVIVAGIGTAVAFGGGAMKSAAPDRNEAGNASPVISDFDNCAAENAPGAYPNVNDTMTPEDLPGDEWTISGPEGADPPSGTTSLVTVRPDDIDPPTSPGDGVQPDYEGTFAKYGAGYDGGHLVYIRDADADKAASMADSFGAGFDGVAFVLPYTEETMEKVLSMADGVGDRYLTSFCGTKDGQVCIIVAIE